MLAFPNTSTCRLHNLLSRYKMKMWHSLFKKPGKKHLPSFGNLIFDLWLWFLLAIMLYSTGHVDTPMGSVDPWKHPRSTSPKFNAQGAGADLILPTSRPHMGLKVVAVAKQGQGCHQAITCTKEAERQGRNMHCEQSKLWYKLYFLPGLTY